MHPPVPMILHFVKLVVKVQWALFQLITQPSYEVVHELFLKKVTVFMSCGNSIDSCSGDKLICLRPFLYRITMLRILSWLWGVCNGRMQLSEEV